MDPGPRLPVRRPSMGPVQESASRILMNVWPIVTPTDPGSAQGTASRFSRRSDCQSEPANYAEQLTDTACIFISTLTVALVPRSCPECSWIPCTKQAIPCTVPCPRPLLFMHARSGRERPVPRLPPSLSHDFPSQQRLRDFETTFRSFGLVRRSSKQFETV